MKGLGNDERNQGSIMGHFRVVILDLEAEILSEFEIFTCSIDSYGSWEQKPSKSIRLWPRKGRILRVSTGKSRHFGLKIADFFRP